MKAILSRKPIFYILLSLCLLLSSCNKILDFFKDEKKDVKRQIESLKAAIGKSDWKRINTIMTRNFSWKSTDGILYKTRRKGRKKKKNGKKYFRESIENLPKEGRMAFFMHAENLRKINKTRYMAEVVSRLRLRTGPGGRENISWKSYQVWVKKKREWKLLSVEDITQKIGSRNEIYSTNPPLPKNFRRRIAR